MVPLKITITFLLFFIHHVEGYKKVITVMESSFNYPDGENQLSCCTTGNCTCHSFLQAIKYLTNDTLINITADVHLSEILQVKYHQSITIVGLDNTIHCNNVGGLSFQLCSNITIEHLNWDKCGTRRSGARGEPALGVYNSSHVTFQNCTIQNSNTRALALKDVSGIVNIIRCRFMHNRYSKRHNGIAIHHSSENSYFLNISGCDFIDNHVGASVIYFQKANHEQVSNLLIQDCNFINNKAVPFCIVNREVLLTGKILFRDNNGATNGGSMAITDYSKATFTDCQIIFERNTAESGGAIFSSDSKISFEENSTIIFNNNSAKQHGGAIYLSSSTLTFKGFASMFFRNNNCNKFGGALYVNKKSKVIFEGNSSAAFTSNSAGVGGAVYFTTASHITFKNHSNISFSFNKAQYGAGSWCFKSRMTITGNSRVMFLNGEVVAAPKVGGGVGFVGCIVKFVENTTVWFANNTKFTLGGAMFCNSTSNITFGHNSKVIFDTNQAVQGGGFRCVQSRVTLNGTTTVRFTNNVATRYGGAISTKQCNLVAEGNSKLTFANNSALEGGAMNAFAHDSTTTFDQHSSIKFINNTANVGGAVYMSWHYFVLAGNSNVSFDTNKARNGGGATYFQHGNVTVKDYTAIVFTNNIAKNGGAIRVAFNSTVTYEEFVTAVFSYNRGTMFGGAMYITDSNLIFASKSMIFSNNTALRKGGALYLKANFYMEYKNSSKLIFYNNSVEDHGGAAYCELDEQSLIKFNTTDIIFNKNNARFGGNPIFVKVPKLWNTSQLQSNVVGSNKNNSKFLTTSPNNLILHSPTKPIDDINGVRSYYMQNIMLGQEIVIDACVLDYFNQTGNVVPFLISTDNCTDINGCQDYYLDGQNMISISCTKFQDISLIGKKILPNRAKNYSIALTSHFSRDSEWKRLMVKVIIELVPCHPGFWYNNHKCECFSAGGVISCSGSNSAIKRGYWFGIVDEKPTVTSCPFGYCNFSCCETTTGFNNLSPQRSNQCGSHRSGTACGSCEDGYTLSFDSIECVDVNKCTTGQAVLVTVLTVIYWIAVVLVVFIMMYYQIGIQYLYGITYYYSMIDILLLPTAFTSQTLYTAISVMSSFAKIIPQFLGRLCLTDGLIGIDQQFIHYTHPLAVSFILVIICLVARCSTTFSAFISKGIIQALCFLLLLSYTSIATTSLLLIRPLTFYDVDKVYTYLSPELEYFHGRHLLYTIIAIICIIVIVVGLPLLLLLEPFLNRKINFVRIKPLLDQFQGCYKDRYRSFSAYYMICRQVLIVMVIINSSDDFTSRYLLVTACTFIALIHLLIRPYASKLLNVLDGIILQLMILVVGISPVDNFNSQLSVVISSILLATPLLVFITMELFIHQKTIKKIFLHCKYRNMRHHDKKETVITKDDIDITIDDNMRKNATICDMYVHKLIYFVYKLIIYIIIICHCRNELERHHSMGHYRESFMEIMDDIKD